MSTLSKDFFSDSSASFPDDRAVSAQSQVLQNQDILSIIFDNIILDPLASDAIKLETRKSLLLAAQTCRVFSEPALDSLWKILPSLVPLLRLFPSFGIVDGVYILEDIRTKDWNRFDTHARRVRVLYLAPNATPISTFVPSRISRNRAGPLLPALKELRIPDNNSIDLLCASIVLGPHLEVVELNNGATGKSEFLRSFLCSLVEESPAIHHLILRGQRPINLKPILQLDQLRELELQLLGTHLSPMFMEDLGNLEGLLNLSLNVGAHTPTVVTPPIRNERPVRSLMGYRRKFKQLKSLHITGTVVLINHVMEYMDLNNLEQFHLREEWDGTGTAVEQFWISCFNKLSASHLLTSVGVIQNARRDFGHPGYSLSASTIHPLFHLQGLKSLVIEEASFCASDSDIVSITKAFPALTRLILPSTHHTFCPTVASLVHLTLACSKLIELKICLTLTGNIQNTATILSRDLSQIPRKHDHPLRALHIKSNFGVLQHKSLIQFAEFLNRAFPNMADLKGYGPNSQGEGWAQVCDLHLMLQSARRDCA